jgi:tyrosyl-tRNA synthetase
MNLDLRCTDTLPSDRPWVIKAGFDPTTPDLHLGHAVLLRALRAWQDQGHEVVLVVGDFTATLGDPTGRNATRPVLDSQTVKENARTYLEQAHLILDPKRTRVVHNSTWLGVMSSAELLGLMQRFTVAQMTARNDFSTRLEAGDAVGLHELIYPLLQGYDSVVLKCDIEVGGQDQLFNLMAGRTLQEMFGQSAQAIAMAPLLVGLDGVRKMSKSYGNHIALRDSPVDIFGKTMRIPDELVADWANLLDVPGVNFGEGAYNAKRALARGLVAMLHGEQAALDADADWELRFAKRQLPEEVREHAVKQGTSLVQVLVDLGFAPSLTVARQKVREGAVRIDADKILDPHYLPTQGILQLGRRHAARILTFARPKNGMTP